MRLRVGIRVRGRVSIRVRGRGRNRVRAYLDDHEGDAHALADLRGHLVQLERRA